jgi:hypothetical protein
MTIGSLMLVRGAAWPQLCNEPQNLLEQLPGNGDLGHLESNAAAMADDLGAERRVIR